MDKEHAKCAADKTVGKTKEAAGHVTSNRRPETEGTELKGQTGVITTETA